MSEIVEQAKEFAEEREKEYKEGTLWSHTLSVLKISLRLAKQTKKCNKEAIAVGCYLHDIGRTQETDSDSSVSKSETSKEKSTKKDNHPELGKEIAELFFEEHPVTEKFKRIVYDIILNHGSFKTPQTTEGKIVSSADKMSLFEERSIITMIYAASKKVDSLEELSTYCIKKFEKKYNAIPLELGKQIIVKKYKDAKQLFLSLK